jgi:hypothetical protein
MLRKGIQVGHKAHKLASIVQAAGGPVTDCSRLPFLSLMPVSWGPDGARGARRARSAHRLDRAGMILLPW